MGSGQKRRTVMRSLNDPEPWPAKTARARMLTRVTSPELVYPKETH